MDGLFELHPGVHLQQHDAQAPHVHGRGAAQVPLRLQPRPGQAVLELRLRGAVAVCLDVLYVLEEEEEEEFGWIECETTGWSWGGMQGLY